MAANIKEVLEKENLCLLLVGVTSRTTIMKVSVEASQIF